MAEQEKSRRLKVLEQLSKFTEPLAVTEIAAMIGENPRDTGHELYRLDTAGLARNRMRSSRCG